MLNSQVCTVEKLKADVAVLDGQLAALPADVTHVKVYNGEVIEWDVQHGGPVLREPKKVDGSRQVEAGSEAAPTEGAPSVSNDELAPAASTAEPAR